MTQHVEQITPRKPQQASVRKFRVYESRRISPSFQRVTIQSTDPDFDQEFTYFGFDHWFRLFFAAGSSPLELPYGGLDGWYQRLTALEHPPIVRNYTIREARKSGSTWQFDVDFVLHRGQSGQVEGEAARWALRTKPGDELGFLDQGCIFSTHGRSPLLLVSDETGLPGAEGILHSLDPNNTQCILEVPQPGDVRELPIDPIWVFRNGQSGQAALEALRSITLDPESDAYIVGESDFVLAARQICLKAGLRKNRIDFCGYWRK
ncbi:MAG: siderophore-interacting protein [Ancrocorticia sp.]|nr:siderophore-interacting protein [Ancrocorticia sp.]